MRHRRKFNHLSRTSAHRKAMLANMASSLILHKRIKTTVAKAKALRVYVEPLLTRSKDDSTHSRRMVFKYLQNKDAVKELFREISVKIAERPGGYTRILKLGPRLGDNAEMCLIELVDFNENLLGEGGAARKKSTRRGRRGGTGKKSETPKSAAPAETAVVDVPEPNTEEISDFAEEVEEVIEETPGAKEEQQPEALKEEQPEAKAEPAEEDVKEEKKEEPQAEKKEEEVEEEKPEEPKAEKTESEEEEKKDDDKEKKE